MSLPMRLFARPAMRLGVLPLVLLAGCGPTPPWPEAPAVAIDLQASLSKPTVALLEPFELTLDLWRRGDLEVEFDPQVPDGCAGHVELLPERELGNGHWRRARLRLRAVQAPGALTIAPFTAKAKDGTVDVSSGELQLEVTSLLADAGSALEAPALLVPPRPWWPWAAAGAALLLLVLGIAWWRRRPVRTAPPPLAISLPPHTKALRELARLRAQSRRTAAEVDAFYVAVSSVLRVYLEERFGLHAPERTTEEFLHEVENADATGAAWLSTAHCLELRRFLQQCDLVKFAALVPDETVHLQTLAIAEQFVEATRVDRAPIGTAAGVGA
jgi:hypothetical protein